MPTPSQSGNYPVSVGTSFANIPKPSGGNVTLFLNNQDGFKLYAMKSTGTIFPVVTDSNSAWVFYTTNHDLDALDGESWYEKIGTGPFLHKTKQAGIVRAVELT